MKRVEYILNDRFYRECLEKNALHEMERRFCRHDFQHMLDVARITYILFLEAGETGGRSAGLPDLPDRAAVKEVIYAAGLVHDIARWYQYETGEDHARAGAEMALPLLDRAGFDRGEALAIAAAVREHRTGGSKSTPLGGLLCRADDLSRPCFQCVAREDCYKFTDNGERRTLLTV